MPKVSTTYVCQQCGYQSPTFLGRCPECDSWNSLVEQIEVGSRAQGAGGRKVVSKSEVIDLAKIDTLSYQRIKTSLGEFDRVLGGGIVVGSIVLISGDPGIGKSTLLTQLALFIDARGPASSKLQSTSSLVSTRSGRSLEPLSESPLDHKVLYVAGEESAQQIKIRVDRIRKDASLSVLNEVDVDVITGVIENIKPSLVIIDSIQTVQTSDLESVAGSVSQVRECAHRLQKIAKKLHIPILLVGHVTKEGTVAGPRTLEHLVDVVISLEGDSNSNFRILRSSKNRFGPTDEVGIFEMEEGGLKEVLDPSKVFLEERVEAPGSAVVATMNGFRPILVEVQALVTKSFLPAPRRVGSGVDNGRLQLLVAVLQKRLGLPLFDQDIFVNVTGGLKVVEPASDLGICLAIVSSLKDKAIKPKTILIGEVGLLGELRSVRNIDKRSSEAKKLGYGNVISPNNAKTLADALRSALTTK